MTNGKIPITIEELNLNRTQNKIMKKNGINL